jgi:hypothetical protein
MKMKKRVKNIKKRVMNIDKKDQWFFLFAQWNTIWFMDKGKY